METFDLVRLLSGTVALAYAAQSDWRTRRVRDETWVIAGTIGLALFLAELVLEAAPADFLLILVPIAALFYTAFYGEEMITETGFRVRWGRLVLFFAALGATLYLLNAYLVVQGPWTEAFTLVLAVPAMLLVVHGLYQIGAIRGGADAKALLAVTLLVPRYPQLVGLPVIALDPGLTAVLQVWFPFSLLVLMNTALLFLAVPLALLAYNAAHRAWKFPEMFLGYRVPIDRVPRFTWPMQGVRDGRVVRLLRPSRTGDTQVEIQRLRAKGLRSVWVTPQLPFLVPVLPGFAVSFVVGNLLFGLLYALT